MNDDRYISLAEAAEYLAISEKTLRRYIDTGVVAGYRVGPRNVRLRLSEVDALLTPVAATHKPVSR